jgi:hypothetical protein
MKDQTRSLTTTTHHHHGNGVDYDDGRWIDTVVSCAQTVNKLFTRNTCRLCHVYSDRQVEYENSIIAALENTTTTSSVSTSSSALPNSPVERACLKAAHCTSLVGPEVELYRQFLFDEESVEEAVYSRTGELDE